MAIQQKQPVNDKFKGNNEQLPVIERRLEALKEKVDMGSRGTVETKFHLFEEDVVQRPSPPAHSKRSHQTEHGNASVLRRDDSLSSDARIHSNRCPLARDQPPTTFTAKRGMLRSLSLARAVVRLTCKAERRARRPVRGNHLFVS